MACQLPKLTIDDLEVTYTRKRKHSISSSSTGSSGNSSPNSSAPTSKFSGPPKKSHTSVTATPLDNYLLKKKTQPSPFCPKQRAATKRFQPSNVEVSKAPKIPYVAKPLQHITQRPLADPENNKDMLAYRAYRQMEYKKAQAAKLTGELEEPPKKKTAPRGRKQSWEHKY